MRIYQEMKSFLGLSIALAKAGFKLRNEGSYLGIFWYLLNPVLLFALLFFVFKDRLGNDIEFYPLYLLLGIIMFNFFQETSLESTKILKGYSGLIKSINFQRESLISSIVIKRIFAHFFEIILFIIVLFIIKGPIANIIFYPIILIFFIFFIYGASLILSSIVIYFIDMENIWAFAVRLIWLSTPIFYSIGGQSKLLIFNMFNPMYYFITITRDVLIYNKFPELFLILGAIGYSLLALLLGLIIFNKLNKKMPEMF